MAKPDSTRSAIVKALRANGASWEDHESRRKGAPDGWWGFRGRGGPAEIKAPGKESGVCGCTHTMFTKCDGGRMADGSWGPDVCPCKGHLGAGNAERTTWHAQLAWREAWQGPPVQVWTSVEDALTALGLGERRAA